MGVYSVVNESSSMQVDAIECQYDNFHEGALAIIAESEFNYGMIMRAIGQEELAVYESTGKEMVYTEASAGGFLEKVKQFFMGIWQKIKGLFNRFIAMFDSFVKTDKEFITKYKKDLYNISHSLKDFKYKGYKFSPGEVTVEGAATKMGTVQIEVQNWADALGGDLDSKKEKFKKINEDYSDYEEDLRGKILGEGKLNASEFNKALFEKLRSGESEKQELDNPNISDIVTQLEGAAEAKKLAKKAFDALEKIIKRNIKQVEDAKSKIVKEMPKDADAHNANSGTSNSDAIQIASTGVKCARTQLALLQTVNGAILTALKDESRQNKSICVSLLHYKPKKEETDMSGLEESGSFLANVKLK